MLLLYLVLSSCDIGSSTGLKFVYTSLAKQWLATTLILLRNIVSMSVIPVLSVGLRQYAQTARTKSDQSEHSFACASDANALTRGDRVATPQEYRPIEKANAVFKMPTTMNLNQEKIL